MPWAVNTPGGQVQLVDLPFSVLDTVEVECGRPWASLLSYPAVTAKSVMVLYRVACEHIGAEPEELTPRKALDGDGLFVEVDDDLPEVFEDGLPKAESAPPTSGSSGPPDDTDGHPT